MNKSGIEILSFAKSFLSTLLTVQSDLERAVISLAKGELPEVKPRGCGKNHEIWKALFPLDYTEQKIVNGTTNDRKFAAANICVAIEAVKGIQHMLTMETLITLKGQGLSKENIFDLSIEELRKTLLEEGEKVDEEVIQ